MRSDREPAVLREVVAERRADRERRREYAAGDAAEVGRDGGEEARQRRMPLQRDPAVYRLRRALR